MSRRIVAVEADPVTLVLHLTWANRARTDYDMRALVARRPAFAPLRDPAVFRQAVVIEDGLGVGWPGTDADCAADRLWFAAHPEDNPFTDATMPAVEFKAWMARNGLSLTRAAATLGLSRRQIAAYASGEKSVPRLVFLACMAVSQAAASGRAA